MWKREKRGKRVERALHLSPDASTMHEKKENAVYHPEDRALTSSGSVARHAYTSVAFNTKSSSPPVALSLSLSKASRDRRRRFLSSAFLSPPRAAVSKRRPPVLPPSRRRCTCSLNDQVDPALWSAARPLYVDRCLPIGDVTWATTVGRALLHYLMHILRLLHNPRQVSASAASPGPPTRSGSLLPLSAS